ncbi:MAG: hypothetical protein E6J33_12115 [Chloroflexi bacterium]|nr:MAG: hypothetical protein E6J33_12115 [Chloroflexota bacterium]
MFGRRFAHRFSRGDWEGWTPPWLEHDWEGPRGPHFFHGNPRHGFFGHGGPSGPGWQWSSPEFQALWSEAAEVARLFAIASRTAFDNRERLGQLRTLLEGARKELTGMIYGTGQSESKSSAPDVEQA